MGRAMLSVGALAQQPYYVAYVPINIYSIEELCYCLHENTFLLTQDIVNKQLVEWIGVQCRLPGLAKELERYVGSAGSLSAFVMTILEYAAYYPPEEVARIQGLLRENEKLPPFEKKLMYADYLLKNRNYTAAVKEYRRLCRETSDKEQLGKLLHNIGVSYAGLFLFEEAAGFFLQAYETAGRMESYRQHLAAKRMQLSEQEYVAFIAERGEAYDTSLVLERRLEQIQSGWEASPQKKRLDAPMEDVIGQMKSEYRAMVIR